MRHRLPDPETCPTCRIRGRVVESRRSKLGYRRRRHECGTCGARWSSWQSVISPTRVRFRRPETPS